MSFDCGLPIADCGLNRRRTRNLQSAIRNPQFMGILCCVLTTLATVASIVSAAEPPSPRLADERIVLRTICGDIVLALYPDVAPNTPLRFSSSPGWACST